MPLNAVFGIAFAITCLWFAIGTSELSHEIWQDIKQMGFIKAFGYFLFGCLIVATFIASFWALHILEVIYYL